MKKSIYLSIYLSIFLSISLNGQVINKQEIGKGTIIELNTKFNLEELKVRWKKAALENCPGVPCPTISVPGPCSSIVATPTGPSSASVSFVPPSSDGGSPITGYTVTATSTPSAPAKRKSSAIITVTGTSSPIVVTGLTFGVNYIFSVVATNAAGGSPSVTTTTTVTPCTLNTAGTPSSSPTLTVNTVLTNITITTTGATGIGTATNLPAGVMASWLANLITISGTPTATGSFNYEIPLTGGCGSLKAIGSITVSATPACAAAAASTTPTLTVNTALTNITHATTSATGIGTASGLPTGVSAAWSSNTITISGTPSVAGTFNYTIPLTGTSCSSVNATGTITVVAATIPGAPTSVVATAGNATASVAFVAPSSTGGSAITGYTVTSNPAGGTATGSSSPLRVTGLTNGTAYTFAVVATNAVGNSVASAASTAVTPATVPGAPTSVVATAGNATASVAFVAPSSTGGSVITGYTVTSNPAGGTSTGSSSPLTVTGLTNGTAYTFTVVATNAVGNSVASAASAAVTPAAPFTCGTSTVSDVDNNSYNTVLIGTQCWTKTNLKVTKYNDGTPIPDHTSNTAGWGGLNSGARSDYTGAGPFYVDTYGYLYNWYASAGVSTSGSTTFKNICPTGYHVPTDSDWNKLVKFIDSGADTSSTSETQSITAGTKLKKDDSLWTTNTGTDNYYFSALPGGVRFSDGSFHVVRNDAVFWSATDGGGGSAWHRNLYYNSNSVERYNSSKSVGASVRCLRD